MTEINFNDSVYVVATVENRGGFVEKEIIRVYDFTEADETAKAYTTIFKKKYDGKGYWLSVVIKKVENFDNPHRGGELYELYMDSLF